MKTNGGRHAPEHRDDEVHTHSTGSLLTTDTVSDARPLLERRRVCLTTNRRVLILAVYAGLSTHYRPQPLSVCGIEYYVEERQTMQLIENRKTGKRHLPGDDRTTACGSSLIQNGKENAEWVDDGWLDDFPEDFGGSDMDCEKCAKAADFN